MSVLSDCIDGSLIRAEARPRIALAPIATGLLLVAVLAFSFSRTFHYPLGQDQACFQYITKMTMDGHFDSVAREVRYYWAVVVLQWLSIRLFGYTEAALHVFDACWQVGMLAVLVLLARRDVRSWSVGLLAAAMYAMLYYAMPYMTIHGRDGLAGLPLLLMVHALIPRAADDGSTHRPLWQCAFAGAMGFWAYMLKLTLGACFGLVWLYLLAEAWRDRRRNRSGFVQLAAVSAGFVATAIVTALILIRAGWWNDFSVLYTAFPPKGYNTGHWLMIEQTPRVLAGLGLVAAVVFVIAWPGLARRITDAGRLHEAAGQLAWLAVAAALLVGLAVTLDAWLNWRGMTVHLAGLFVPAIGAVLARPWRDRSPAWRMCLLIAAGATVSLVLQGNFYHYHYLPMCLFASYLAAGEIARAARRLRRDVFAGGGWAVACVASVVCLALVAWWPYMTAQAGGLNVLADASPAEYKGRVASHYNNVPEYATARKVAARVRELTAPGEPMACLMHDTRIYYFADRPMTFDRIFIFCRGWEVWYDDLINAIREKQPKAMVARLPLDYAGPRDPVTLTAVVMDDLENKFGPRASTIRELYVVGQAIDDVAILVPRSLSAPTMARKD